MHGNVWEWTRSLYRPYPYRDDDGRNETGKGDRSNLPERPATNLRSVPGFAQIGPVPFSLPGAGRRVVRGGSWYDRPKRCTSAFRLDYAPYQNVFNVGFRVVMEEKWTRIPTGG